MSLTESRPKRTRKRDTRPATERKPIEPEAFYTVRDLTDRRSPFFIASESTIFRAIREGRLIPNYIGRCIRIRGGAVHSMLNGGEGGR